jgi:hypothetical protein
MERVKASIKINRWMELMHVKAPYGAFESVSRKQSCIRIKYIYDHKRREQVTVIQFHSVLYLLSAYSTEQMEIIK